MKRKQFRWRERKKYSLCYRIILFTKYRRKILGPIANTILKSLLDVTKENNEWAIEILNIDKEEMDHIHFFIKAKPYISPERIIKKLKQASTYYVWQLHHDYMNKLYKTGKHHLWARGYFCYSTGKLTERTIKTSIKK